MSLRLFGEQSSDQMPLLRWLMFTGVSAFGFAVAWHYGLFHLMVANDKTWISTIISVLYVVVSLHCLVRTVVISNELTRARRVSAIVSQSPSGFRVEGSDVLAGNNKLPPGRVAEHIRNLVLKADLQGRHRLDQTLLLRGFADALRGPNQFGSFASDALMKLGLLGTIIGFILMLAPIAGLDAADRASVKTSMGLMSDGMAVAMYTTLAGLVSSILVQAQYYMLDDATANLFALATDLTEVFVISTLEREQDG
jgi:hypothetical protein